MVDDMQDKLAENKKNAMEFYRTAYMGDPKSAVEEYAGDDYIQHNPQVKNGKDGFIEYFDQMHEEYPNKQVEFVRAVAEGDMVALHSHQIWPDDEEYVTMDFFRFDDNGKIVEHWDSIQKIPADSRSGNSMY